MTFSSATPGVCTVNSAGAVTFDHAGTCTVQADQAGSAHNAPASAQQSFTVARATQAITFTSTPPTGAVVGDFYTASATATSNAAVTFSSGRPTVCTVSPTGTVRLLAAGTCTILADQAGTADYIAAPQASQAVAVSRVASTVTVDAPDGRPHGQPTRINASVSVASGSVDGTVQFAVDGTPLGGPVTVAGASPVTVLSDPTTPPAGAHQATAVFTPTDTTTYAGATGSDTLATAQASTTSTITVTATTLVADIAPVAPGAGSPTGTVSFTVDGAAVGTATLEPTATGARATLTHSLSENPSHTVAASYAGDADFGGSTGTSGTTGVPAADLGVSFTSKAPDWAQPGSVVKLSLRTANAGPLSATGAVTTVRLPRGWRVRRTSDDAVVRHHRLVMKGDLVAGGIGSAYIVLQVGRKVKAVLTAEVASTVPDPVLADNTDRLRITPSRLDRRASIW